MTSDDSCIELEDLNSVTVENYAEDDLDYLEERRDPELVAVYNGRILDISGELIADSLSGISLKHYNGDCSPPEEPLPYDDYLIGEDYVEYEMADTKSLSQRMSSMIRLCYEPRKRGSAVAEDGTDDASDYGDKPMCLREKINLRNSFWDLHRPELCKLTWPHDYVAEAIVTQHLHRHLRKHGAICAAFHEQSDMSAMLDKELDLYDKLKTIQSPREIPPDEEHVTVRGKKPRKMKFDPCRPVFKPPPPREDTDDDIESSRVVRPSKEEFCITIGRPIKRKPIRDDRIEEIESQSQIWLPHDWGELQESGREYAYEDYCSDSSYSSETVRCEDEEEYREMDETTAEESAEAEPPRWVEPDYCAMV